MSDGKFPNNGGERRYHDTLLERVISLTEKSVAAQHEYVNRLNELISRFGMNDRDHVDIKKDTSQSVANTFDILNKMNKDPNAEIIKLLEESEETHRQFVFNWERISNSIVDMNKGIAQIIPSITDNICKKIESVESKTIATKDAFGLVQKVLAILFAIVLAFQLGTTIMNNRSIAHIEDKIINMKE